MIEKSALEQARLIREGAVSSEELARLYLARIERLNPTLWPFVSVFRKRALWAAKKKDRLLRNADPALLPPFHGVPIGIKDLNPVRCSRLRLGSRAFRWLWTPMDDPVVARIRRGGFVFLGKTSTPELGTLSTTEPDLHPPTRNPWNPDFTPGGSSGGAGAALAAGLHPIAHGNDAAGSIRIPSAFCHLYGLKPSRGRVVNPVPWLDPVGLHANGPIARTVEDAAAFLDVIADPTLADRAGGERFLAQARRPPRRLRIRFTTVAPLGTTEPEIAQGVIRVAKTLSGLGHEVEEGAPFQGTLEELLPLLARFVANFPVLRPSVLQPTTRWLRCEGKKISKKAMAERFEEIRKRVEEWFGGVDLWVTPTVPVFPPRVGAWKDLSPEATIASAALTAPFTMPFNVGGQAAASLPGGIARNGLPYGVQLVGPPLDEGTVLQVSRQVEEALPWRERLPPPFRES